MNFHDPQFSATDVIALAKINHTTLQNWLRHGLLDRLGTTRPESGWLKYSLHDALIIVAEAKLSAMWISPTARNKTRMAEQIATRCMALISGQPEERHLVFFGSPDLDEGTIEIVIDCQKLADDVLAALQHKEQKQ